MQKVRFNNEEENLMYSVFAMDKDGVKGYRRPHPKEK